LFEKNEILVFTERALTLIFPLSFSFSFSIFVLSFFSTIGEIGVSFFLLVLNKSSSSSLSRSSFSDFFVIAAGGGSIF